MAKKTRIPHKFLPWIEARKKFSLSHKHIQMARELGLSPKKFGGYADRRQQPWKLPLPEFIEFLYQRQFKKEGPDEIKTMEELAANHVAQRAEKKANKPSTPTSENASDDDSQADNDDSQTDTDNVDRTNDDNAIAGNAESE